MREITFIGLNAIIDGQEHNYANADLPSFLHSYSVSQLIQLKWILTAVFALFFALLTYFGIRLALSRAAGVWVLFLYGILCFAVVAVLLTGFTVLDFNAVYPMLRAMIGIVHSPLLFLLVSISYYATETLKKQ